ncbi:MAG: LLM class flavin-dependent oxidoreductase [Chloroflexi bacterium]|nr:LLM class flavin-dependent oxidoreductase [Chloroflexota bacterium]
MRFGLMINSDEPAERDPLTRLDEHLERARTARGAGFHTLAAAHRNSFGPARPDDRGEPLVTSRFQPLLLLAYLAAEMRDTMHYATTILLSTSAHPAQLAEDVATLDAFCHCRLRLGLGLGWMPFEFEAFGVPKRERVGRFEELLEVYRRLLDEESVTFEGRHFRVRDARLIARSVQRPRPPLWVGASSDRTVRRAARFGDAWIISGHITLDVLERQLALYRAELDRLGKPFPAEFPIVRMVHVAADRETALKEAEPVLADWYRKRGDWGWFLTQGPAKAVTDEMLRTGRWIMGDPNDCVEQIANLRDRLGVDHLIFGMPWPRSEQEKRLRTIRLLGERVIPHLK